MLLVSTVSTLITSSFVVSIGTSILGMYSVRLTFFMLKIDFILSGTVPLLYVETVETIDG